MKRTPYIKVEPISSLSEKELFEAERQSFLSDYDEGCYEPKRIADIKPEDGVVSSRSQEDLVKRDSRVSLRVSSEDLQMIQREAMRQGVPSQSLLANIIHDYVSGLGSGISEVDDKDLIVLAPENVESAVVSDKAAEESENPEKFMRPDFSRGVSLNEVFVEAVRKESVRQLKKTKTLP